MNNQITKSSTFWSNFNQWIYYWRKNIHRFIIEYMCLDIHLFQQVIVYLMDSPNANSITSFIFFASRGLGKTFICMVFCTAKAILYPGIKIIVASSTIKQATIFIQKINEIKEGRPNIENEILSIKIGKDGGSITFTNGSVIEAVVASDSSRGIRSNILICDESRLMNEETVNSALIPTLTLNNRGQPWAYNPKYKKYLNEEHNSKIYLTSIGYKDEWSYKDFVKYCNFIAEGRKDYFAFSLPYQFGIESGVIQKSYIESVVREKTSDLKSLQMEFEVIPHGESESAMFTFDEINNARQLRVPLIPPTDDEYIECKGNYKLLPYYQKKEVGEIRVISMDIAISGGRVNDLSVFTVFRCQENTEYYDKELAYIEVMDGVNLDRQILRLKQLFYDFECDYAVIDAGGAIGIEAVNSCGSVTKDIVRNRRYPGWKTMNKVERFDMRITDPNAQPVLYPIQVTGSSASAMQYNMLVIAKLELERKRLFLLVDEDIAVDELNKRYKYLVLSTSNNFIDKEKSKNMIIPYSNTTKLTQEAIKTQIIKLPSGRWVYDEKGGRKDRVISMLYGLFFINKLEEDLVAMNKNTNISEYTHIYTNNSKRVNNPFSGNMNKLRKFGVRR